MSVIDALLSRLDHPRQSGADRWRCACPVCGGKNRSTLSVGVGDNGAVLLKCWKLGCGPEQIAVAVGLTIEDLFPPKDAAAKPQGRARLLTPYQAMEILHDETQLIALCASDMAQGVKLSDRTRARLMKAAGRVSYLFNELPR